MMPRLVVALAFGSLLVALPNQGWAQGKPETGFVVQLVHAFNPDAAVRSLERLQAAKFDDIRVFSSPTRKGRVYRVVTRAVPSYGDARLVAAEAKRIARTRKLRIEATILRVADIGQPFVR